MLFRRLLSCILLVAASGPTWASEAAALPNAPLPAKNDLMSVYYDAVNNNADLAVAHADYLAQLELVPQARAALLPLLTGGFSYIDTRTSLDQPSITAKRNSSVIRATLTQPLFRADRWFQLQAAKEITEQASLIFSSIQQELIFNSAQVYFSALRAQDTLAASKAEEEAIKRQLDMVQERFKVGLSDMTDVLEAQATYDTARANRLIAERYVQDAFQALMTLTNRDYPVIEGIRHSLPILSPTPNEASAWVDTSLQQNLRLMASEFNISAANETLSQRKAGHLPTLDAVAQYRKGDNDALGFNNSVINPLVHYGDYSSDRSIGLELTIPIYSGGMTNSQVREAYQRLNQNEQRHESLRRSVVESARNLHRAVNTDVEQVQARRKAILSSQSSVEATQVGFDVGTRNIVDVLAAQRQLYNAVRDYNNARYDYILHNLQLKQVAGTLSPDDLRALAAYLKPDYDPDKDFLPEDLKQMAATQQMEIQRHSEMPSQRPVNRQRPPQKETNGQLFVPIQTR